MPLQDRPDVLKCLARLRCNSAGGQSQSAREVPNLTGHVQRITQLDRREKGNGAPPVGDLGKYCGLGCAVTGFCS
jgi:hypothetical protein